MNVDMSGPDLALYLAKTLTSLEFELLLRNRITLAFELAVKQTNDQVEDNHHACSFHFNWSDKSYWCTALGMTYNDTVSIRGEVFETTVYNCAYQWQLQHMNKLSLLLPTSKNEEEI